MGRRARRRARPGLVRLPELLFLVLAPTQIGLDEPSYGTARVVAIALGVIGVAAAWWLGGAPTGPPPAVTGAVGVAVATTHVAYSRMAVTDVLLALGITVTLALLVSGRLEWAGVAAGLAASAKYPGGDGRGAARGRVVRAVAARSSPPSLSLPRRSR